MSVEDIDGLKMRTFGPKFCEPWKGSDSPLSATSGGIGMLVTGGSVILNFESSLAIVVPATIPYLFAPPPQKQNI